MKKVMLIVLIGMSFFMASCGNEAPKEITECAYGEVLIDEECRAIESDCFEYEYSGNVEETLNLRLQEFECKTEELYFEYESNYFEEIHDYSFYGTRVDSSQPELGRFLTKEQILEYQEDLKTGIYRGAESQFIRGKILELEELQDLLGSEIDILSNTVDLVESDTMSSFMVYNKIHVQYIDENEVVVYLVKNSRSPVDNTEVRNERVIILRSEFDTLHVIDFTIQENPLLPDEDFFEYVEFIEDEKYIKMRGTTNSLDYYYERNIKEDTSIHYVVSANTMTIEYKEQNDSYIVKKNDISDTSNNHYVDRDDMFDVFEYKVDSDLSYIITYNLLYADGWDKIVYHLEMDTTRLVRPYNLENEGEDLGIVSGLSFSLRTQYFMMRYDIRVNHSNRDVNQLEQYGLTFMNEYDLDFIDERFIEVEEMVNGEHHYDISPSSEGIGFDLSEILVYLELFREEE